MRFAGLVLALFVLLPGHAAGQRTPVGRWLTQGNDAVIVIEPCGDALCGRIVGLTLDRPGDAVQTDYRGQSQCGLTIIRDAVPDGASAWAARITDPRDGSTYRARLQLDEQGRLRVRGYIGIALFGRTEVWTPFAGAVPDDCRLIVQ